MPPQGGAPQGAQAASQSTSVYRAMGASAQQTAGSETKSYQPVAQHTQTYQPPRQDTNPYQPPQPTQYYGYAPSRANADSAAGEEFKPLTQDTQSFTPAPVDPNAKRLNLQIKTARVEMEELPTQYAEEDPFLGKKRVRRTERNKALYDEDNPNA